MKTLRAVAVGFGQAIGSPGLVVCLLVVSLVVALPDTMLIRQAVQQSVGASLAHERLRDGFDMEWYSDYQYNTGDGVESLLTPTSVRPAAFLDNLEAWFSGDLFTLHPAIVAVGIVFALLWSLVLGGILYRFVHQERRFSLKQLLSRGSGFFFRFVRLMALMGVAYYGVYRFSRWLFPWLEELMRDVTVERDALVVYLLGATVVLALLMLVKLSSDYAKVATVLEGRRSMLLAAFHGLRFVVRHPLRTFGAYALVAVAGLGLLYLYAQIAPGQDQTTLTGVVAAFLIAQAFLAVRLVQRLTTYGAAVEIYRDVASGD
jgi:hypothetical protein